MIGTLAAQIDHSWHYAGWVVVDLRLLLFLAALAAVGSFGVCLVLVKPWRPMAALATFIVGFTLTWIALILVFNSIAGYPVFVLERFFLFP